MPAATVPRRLKLSEASRVPTLSILFILPLTVFLLSLFSSSVLQGSLHSSKSSDPTSPICSSTRKKNKCNYAEGEWVFDREREPLYGETCPFQRNAWNCGKNKRPGLDNINRWKWVSRHCVLPAMDPASFLFSIQNMNIGFVGDSLNENLLVSLLCILASADPGARRWKKLKAWRGAYFPKYNVTVGYHRAVLLADYHVWKAQNLSGPLEKLGFKRGFQVNVDSPAPDWINATDFYDIVIFNTGHCHAGGVLISSLQTIPFYFISTGNQSSPHWTYGMD